MKKKMFIITMTLVFLLSMTSFAFADEKLPPVGMINSIPVSASE